MVMKRTATPALHALQPIVWQAWKHVLAANSIGQDATDKNKSGNGPVRMMLVLVWSLLEVQAPAD